MGAESVVYRVEQPPPPPATDDAFRLLLTEVQRVRGKGAHGADSFVWAGGDYLVIPSYYGCGSARACRRQESRQMRKVNPDLVLAQSLSQEEEIFE